MGKGSDRRPAQVTEAELTRRWQLAFPFAEPVIDLDEELRRKQSIYGPKIDLDAFYKRGQELQAHIDAVMSEHRENLERLG